ncbi:Nitrous-oxide reductase [Candidatus Thermoflexus japonica]|uniref:Nitrous-oxide reductase n=1 Tax=Candidatus Thermoflexus japonica TaxID=2035417 RepID=A0A2H5Y9Z3_9CHLR|nr:Nitrous-oxide reductase [Candidatus Thermoflexus japonica]
MMRWKAFTVIPLLLALLVAACARGAATPAAGLPAEAQAVIKDRGLSPEDIVAALRTYVPGGKYDEYIMFASGGHSGQVLVIGIPSMRLLKVIGVFTPEPWQGYGFGEKGTLEVLEGGFARGKPILWGDTHHPALSETEGDYDGQFLFINDKANARLAVIDLRDFETKQIVKNPNAISDHGGGFVTPNTEYVVEGPQYAAPIGWEYAPLDQYKDQYRGLLTFWAFDRQKGRVDPDRSFQIELPPYWQDLCDAGKKVSYGWVFCNSINTEMATGGIEEGNPPFEAGTARNEMDYLHIINWKKAEELIQAGKYEVINGIKVIRLPTAAQEGVLFFAPEPKSPHGVDVAPGGEYIVVGGKLDPHVTVYSFEKIQKAIAAGNFERDPFGVPVLKFEDVKEAQVELGLGPLHTVFDDKGYAYTSLFLDSAVAKWSLGGSYRKDGAEPWKLVEKLPVHYNIGHIAATEGDTVSPDGKYVVALNKWSVDRFPPVGPLHPQNFQLIDITGGKMRLLYDMPIGIGEPHYAQIIKADKLKPFLVYPEIGWNAVKMAKDPNATEAGRERVEVREEGGRRVVEIWMTAIRSHFKPERVHIKKGDHVIWHITNIERARDATHGFALGGYNINLSLEPGETATIEFDADQSGTFPFYCTEFCSALHLEMMGYFLVEP